MRQTVTHLIDDIDGSEAVETVLFGSDGHQLEIDLSEVHAKELRDSLAVFVGSARKVTAAAGAPKQATAATGDRVENQAIREWAWGNGVKVGERGRIPHRVKAAWVAAGSPPAAS